MRRKNFVLSIAAAAVLGAFNPVWGQTINANPNVGVDANVGISNTDVNAGANISPGVNVGSGDQSVSSSTTANQSSTDVNSSSTISQDASTSQSVSGSGEERERHGKAKGHEDGKLTGLDRADQMAGEHGQYGRENAREKQRLN